MNSSKTLVLAVLAVAGIAGCHRGASSSSTSAARTSYTTPTASGDLIVVPGASKLADLSRPVVSVKDNSVTISGTVTLRGPFNRDAVMRIIMVDRHGKLGDEIRASLKETDTNGLLTYSVHFAPLPEKGTSISISYDDYHPISNYSAANIGTGGAGGSSAGVNTGAGTYNSGKGGRSSGKGGKSR